MTLLDHLAEFIARDRLVTPFATDKLRSEIIAAVEPLESIDVKDLVHLLSQAQPRPM